MFKHMPMLSHVILVSCFFLKCSYSTPGRRVSQAGWWARWPMLFQWSIEPLRLGAQQDIAGLREAVGATIKARNVHGPFIDDLPIKMSLVGGLEHVLFFISYMGCHPSHWRTHSIIFFKMNQVCMFTKKMDMYCEWYEDLLSKDNNSMHYIL